MDLTQQVRAAVEAHLAAPGAAGLAVGVSCGGTEAVSFHAAPSSGEPPPGEGTLFEIGSITKVFTGTLLAEMVLRGEVALDDPVNRFLPEGSRLTGAGEPVTLRHLATHTSGLPRLPRNLDSPDLDPLNPYAHYTVEHLLEAVRAVRVRRPDTQTLYSNFGTGLLGHVLGRAAGIPYEDLVRKRVLVPLQMHDTAVRLSPEQAARMAAGHSGGKVVPGWDTPALPAAGALRSTLPEMMRFLRANLQPEETPLWEALRLAQTIQIRGRYRPWQDPLAMALLLGIGGGALLWREAFGLPGFVRALLPVGAAWLAFRYVPTGLETMALGWHTTGLPGSRQALWHNGGTGGFASYMAFCRESGTGVVLLASSDVSPDPVGERLMGELHADGAGTGPRSRPEA